MLLELITQFWYVWAFFVGFFVIRKKWKKQETENKKIIIISHRGAKGHEVENSEQAFKKAVEIGVDYIECDVRRCADGEFYLSHDRSISFRNSRKKEIAKLANKEIENKELKNGTKLMTLTELISILPATQKILLDLKIKGAEAEFVKFIEKNNLEERVLISSHYWESLRLIKVLNEKLIVGVSYPKDRFKHYQYFLAAPFLTPIIIFLKNLYPFYIGLICSYAKADFVSVNFRFFISRRLIKAAHKRNILVFAFSVNRTRHIKKMIKWGVDGIVSDYPDRVKEVVQGRRD